MTRKTVRIAEGQYDKRFGGRGYLYAQEVRVVRAVPGNDDDEWIVQPPQGGEFIVSGCDLSPHPEDRETNVELVTRIMEFSAAGALIQVFVLEALRIYSEQIKAMPQDQRDKMDAGMIAYAGWARCADEVLQVLADRKREG